MNLEPANVFCRLRNDLKSIAWMKWLGLGCLDRMIYSLTLILSSTQEPSLLFITVLVVIVIVVFAVVAESVIVGVWTGAGNVRA